MPEYLFDSTVLIDNFRGKTIVAPFIQPVLDGAASAWFSVITEAELWAGIKASHDQARYEAMFALMKRLPVTQDIARAAGRFYGVHRHQGLSLPDALIAASAKIHDKTLLTRNSKHFTLVSSAVNCEFYTL